jgi:hypothetical protein
MFVSNASDERVAFRDDSGKHFLESGEGIEVVGLQHLPAILAVPGIVEGKVPKPRKGKVAEPVIHDPEADALPEDEEA